MLNAAGILYLGWRYVRRRFGTVLLLIATVTLSLFLPLGVYLLINGAEQHLRERSRSTPMLFGTAGSPLELAFNGLYFSEPGIATVPVGDARALGRDGLATVIPIHARFSARGFRVVGTSLDYFAFRRLQAADGRLFSRLGDCVLGSVVARDLGLAPGDTITTTPEQVFDLAGVYPLRMRITGVLPSTGGADDRAVFVDVRTAWIVEGIAHGHDEPEAGDDSVLSQEGNNTALNASVREFTEVTADNIASFHFHGDPATFPLTAAIVVPRDARSATRLLGRFVSDGLSTQLVRANEVMDQLFATVFQIRNFVIAALLSVGGMALLITCLVFVLSHRLREREFHSLASIGAEPSTLFGLKVFEAGLVVLTSLAVSGLLVLALGAALPTLLSLWTA